MKTQELKLYLHIWKDVMGGNFWMRAVLGDHETDFKNMERLFVIKREVFGEGMFGP